MTLLQDVSKELLERLSEAQSHRAERQSFENGEFGWNTFEKQTMLAEVNRLRESVGKPPVSKTEIDTVELMASGHVDYSKKFAFYCAALAVE